MTKDIKVSAKETNKKPKKNSASKTINHRECQNCETVLTGAYCHICGQAAKEPRRLIIGLVQDVFVETLSIDGKLARSLALLIAKPGQLARHFLDGKRVSYSPPFRLYLFASVFFFFLTFWVIKAPIPDDIIYADGIEPAIEKMEADLKEEGATDEEIQKFKDQVERAGNAGEDSRNTTINWNEADFQGPEWLKKIIQRTNAAAQRVIKDPRLFFVQSKEYIPRFLLLAPVIYGIILSLLYIYRRKFLIYDHFITSLYMHAAMYTYFVLALLISITPMIGFLWFVPILWGCGQTLFVFRQTYGSNWFSTIGKWLICSFVYLLAIIIIITIGLSYSLYQS